ncbi:hypothetical protein ACFL5V_00225 [Fibrobacterota bacterium]
MDKAEGVNRYEKNKYNFYLVFYDTNSHFAMMKRSYFQLLNVLLSFFPCVAIIGPRQDGKTTPAKELKGLHNFIEEFKYPFGIVLNNDIRVTMYTNKMVGIPVAIL